MASPREPSADELSRLGGAASRHPSLRRSPDGAMVIRPAFDEKGTIYIASLSAPQGRVLFSLKSALSADELEDMYWQDGIPQRPDAYFWAGDGSGVFLYYYASGGYFFYVAVPSGEATRLTSDVFFSSRDLSRQVQVVCSPAGSGDVIVLEKSVTGGAMGPPWSYRLLRVDRSGRVIAVPLEVAGVAEAIGSCYAVAVAMNPEATGDPWAPRFGEVRLLRFEEDGDWSESRVADVRTPAVRGCVLTGVRPWNAEYWVVAYDTAGAHTFLSPVPDDLAGVGSPLLWDDDGRCLYFTGTSLMVREGE